MTCLTFLNLEIDTLATEARLPADELPRLSEILLDWHCRRYCQLREHKELAGLLHFASTVAPSSRAFIRSLFSSSASFPSIFSSRRNPRWAHDNIDLWLCFLPL